MAYQPPTEKEVKKQLYSFLQTKGVDMYDAREMIEDCNIIICDDVNLVCASWLYATIRNEDKFNVIDGKLIHFEDFGHPSGPLRNN